MFPYEVFLLCFQETFYWSALIQKSRLCHEKFFAAPLQNPLKLLSVNYGSPIIFEICYHFPKNPSCAPIRYYLKAESFLQLYILGTLNFLQIHLWLQKCFLLNTFHFGLFHVGCWISWYWSLQRLNNYLRFVINRLLKKTLTITFQLSTLNKCIKNLEKTRKYFFAWRLRPATLLKILSGTGASL